jgi:uncharacterized coiled-coil DUF342 family protein
MEDRIKKLEERVDILKDKASNHDVIIARMDVRVEAMHKDINRLIHSLDELNESIKPLSEWASKSKGSIATLGALLGLVFVIVGALVTQLFKRLFDT